MGRALALAFALLVAAAPAPAAAQEPLGAWGSGGRLPGQFRNVSGLAADAHGYVYVADSFEGRVQKFTADGRFVRAFGKVERDFGAPLRVDEMAGPRSVAVAPGGGIYVVEDSGRVRVSVWSPTGRFLRAFGDAGDGDGQLHAPGQIVVDSAGLVYVADEGNHRVEVFGPDGAYRASIGRGSGLFVQPDQLSTPSGVALGADGSIWAVDTLYRRVQHYSPTGAFLGSFGSEGSAAGQFEAPVALATRGDEVIVADRALSSVQRFGTDGAYRARIGGSPGAGPGQFSHPHGLAVDCRGTLYVADTDNVRVQRLGVPGATPCGDVDNDPSERLAAALSARRRQHFARQFAIRLTAGCDRPCQLVVSGTVRVRHGRAFKLRAVKRALDGRPATVLVALGERQTDRVLAALRRHRRVSAQVTATAVDLRGQRVAVRRTIRLVR